MTEYECNHNCDIENVAVYHGSTDHYLDCPVWQMILHRPEYVIAANQEYVNANPTRLERFFEAVATVSAIVALIFFMLLLFAWIGWIN